MKVAFFSAKPYEREAFEALDHDHEITYLEERLTETTAHRCQGHRAVSVFTNDILDATVIHTLAREGCEVIALRCAGCNHVDFDAADETGMRVVHVPAYSPHAVAEHAVALMMAVIRHVHRAADRVRNGNYALHGLTGFDVVGKTVGVIGTGRIGTAFARILGQGFRARVIAHDPAPNRACREMGVEYTSLGSLLDQSDIIALHCPLTEQSHHLIDAEAIAAMKPGVVLVNTARGGVIDTLAVIDGLKSGRVGALAIDVYEHEGPLFFEDRSDEILKDDTFARLLTFHNVLITGHQAFLTHDALEQIARQTVANLTCIETGAACEREITPADLQAD
ncbi:2-hydroxyacid dehydrogenase [Guyparkeria sp.]|uniref:2-hydroxyacid dehydrogenase n=1 Tax=Guyparkeria sp. TaxID=2035736 RepID=UPI00356949C6